MTNQAVNSAKPRVFLVDDQASFSQITSQLIDLNGAMEVCGCANSAEEAIQQIKDSLPDILLTDLSMSSMDGIEFIQTIKKSHPQIRCAVLSGHRQQTYSRSALEAGADGYILKGNAEEIIKGLDCIAKGDVYISPGVA